jgi:octaprenyl-diphosphate synthase
VLRRAIETGEVERLQQVIAIVRRTGAIEATREAARPRTVARARQARCCCPRARPARRC